MRESDIEKTVCTYAETQGFLVRKFTSPGSIGVPDQLFWGYGEHFLIEFKATGEEPSPAQSREHVRLRAAGAKIFVVDDIAFGKKIVDGAKTSGESNVG